MARGNEQSLRESYPREKPRKDIRDCHVIARVLRQRNVRGGLNVCRLGEEVPGLGRAVSSACLKQDSEQLRFSPRTWLPLGGTVHRKRHRPQQSCCFEPKGERTWSLIVPTRRACSHPRTDGQT